MGRFGVWILGVSLLGGVFCGCGAAPGYEDEASTTPVDVASLQPLQIGEPQAEIAGSDGVNVTFHIRVQVHNPNQAELTMRRVVGALLLDGQQAAQIEIDGAEVVSPDSDREFVLDIDVPVHLLARVGARTYVGQGTVYADAGAGDGALESPFRFEGDVPR